MVVDVALILATVILVDDRSVDTEIKSLNIVVDVLCKLLIDVVCELTKPNNVVDVLCKFDIDVVC